MDEVPRDTDREVLGNKLLFDKSFQFPLENTQVWLSASSVRWYLRFFLHVIMITWTLSELHCPSTASQNTGETTINLLHGNGNSEKMKHSYQGSKQGFNFKPSGDSVQIKPIQSACCRFTANREVLPGEDKIFSNFFSSAFLFLGL